MNLRFHRSSVFAFPKTTEYACAVSVVHRSFFISAWRLLRSLFRSKT